MKVAIVGDGKMARTIATVAAESGDEVTASFGLPENAEGAALTPDRLNGADVVFEFTTPASVRANLDALRRAGATVVCGTTGWDASRGEIEAAWQDAPGALMVGSNFSLGIQVMLRAAKALATAVRDLPEFDGYLEEHHHRAKLDAPSGTALLLQRALGIADASRPWPITSVRAGWIPGNHELVLDGAFESIVLRHTVRDRRVFAAGALAAAHWLQGRQGVYTFDAMFAGE